MAAAVLLVAATATSSPTPKVSLRDLAFMAGCWRAAIQGDDAAKVFALESPDDRASADALTSGASLIIEERYTAQSHDMILGMSSTTPPDKPTSRTFYVIDKGADSIRYQPFGRNGPLPSLTLVRATKKRAIFENLQNDHLRRITYERVGTQLQFTLENAGGIFARVALDPIPCRHDVAMHYAFGWGWYGRGVGQLDTPSGIAVFRDEFGVDRIVLSDTKNDRLRIYTASGMFNEKWGKHGGGESEFSAPLGVAVLPSTDIVVADSQNDRIQITSGSPPDLRGQTGIFRLAFGKHGIGPGEFDKPVGVAVDAAHNIWVTDSGNGRVQKFDSEGKFLLAFGGRGSGRTEMRDPAGIAVDDRGVVYVADSGNQRVVAFAPDGSLVLELRGPHDRPLVRPRGVALDRQRRLYVADAGGHRIEVFSNDGRWLGAFGQEGSAEGELRDPESVAVSLAGDVFVADSGNHRIQVFRPGAAW
jgi:DNA-binding beta-propeller fold protein YncE